MTSYLSAEYDAGADSLSGATVGAHATRSSLGIDEASGMGDALRPPCMRESSASI